MEGKLIRAPGSKGGSRRKPRQYPLGRFTAAYFVALTTWLGSKIAFIALLGFGNLAAFVVGLAIYAACGVYLSRLISHNVAFNPNFANLASVAHAKWRTTITWPLAVPVFLVQLAIAQYL